MMIEINDGRDLEGIMFFVLLQYSLANRDQSTVREVAEKAIAFWYQKGKWYLDRRRKKQSWILYGNAKSSIVCRWQNAGKKASLRLGSRAGE